MTRQFIVFNLNEEEFGISIDNVQEIVNVQAITGIPHSESFIRGIVNLRGSITPIVDLASKFNFDRQESIADETNAKIIILSLGEQRIGVLVDGVSEILTIEAEALEKPPALVTRRLDTAFIGSVAKVGERLIIILDIEKTFSEEDISRFSEAGKLEA